MIYLDNAATTRMDERVLEEMLPYLASEYANPSAAYSPASKVRRAIGTARERVAALIGAEPDEIVFTSGGTESDAAAIMGLTAQNNIRQGYSTVITSQIEHPAVSRQMAALEQRGYRVKALKPDKYGIIDPSHIEKSVNGSTGFMSIMTANNEIGSVNDITAIGELCSEHGIIFHTDAVQAVGHIPIDVRASHIDALSASGHKLHGPKGTGFLFIRRGLGAVPLINGGGQERGLRSGTENVAGIVGLGAACELAAQHMTENAHYIAELRDRLIGRVLNEIPDCILNGPDGNCVSNWHDYAQNGPGGNCVSKGSDYSLNRSLNRLQRLPGNAHFAFKDIEGASLVIQLDMAGICASTGSACSASAREPSPVLQAIGLDKAYAAGSLRLTLSQYTTQQETDDTVDVLKRSVEKLRAMRS